MSDNHYTTIPLVGIDIGKNVHVVGTYRPPSLESMHKPFKILNNQYGAKRLITHIEGVLAEHPAVHIGHEPTGVYYDALGRCLQAHFTEAIRGGRLRYEFVNPYLVKLARQQHQQGRARKSDAIDTYAIAHCLHQGQGRPAHFVTGQMLRLKQWGKHWHQIGRAKRHMTISVLSQLDRLWPGAAVNLKRFRKAHPDMPEPAVLIQTRPLERKLIRALLTHCPNPHDALAFTEAEMIQFLREYVGRGGIKTARKVLRHARQALLPPPDVAAIYAESIQTNWERYQALARQHEALAAQAEPLVTGSPAEVLLSVPGMSHTYAARYLAAIQTADRFPSADHIWSFAGFDPAFAQSGDGTWKGSISKRGSAALRDTLFCVGTSLKRHCAPIGAAYKRAYRGHPSDYARAVIHAAHKSNRLLFHLLRHQQVYDPTRHR